MNPSLRVGKDYIYLIGFFALLLATVVPVGMGGVYLFDIERKYMAYLNFWVFDIAMYGMLLTPWLPLKSLANHSKLDRLTLMVQAWVVTYAIIAVTFEIPWIFMWETIGQAQNELWAYTWWAYIEGGDSRYLDPSFFVLMAEASACIVGVIGGAAIIHWFRSGRNSIAAVYVLMFCSAMHIWPTIYYYTDEILHGFPHVDTTVASNWLAKFILSNSAWLWMPLIVLYWGSQMLKYFHQKAA